MTIAHDALDLTVQDPPAHGTWYPSGPSSPPDTGPPGSAPAPLVTYGGHHWRPAQTCSLDLTVQGPTSGGHQSTYGWQAGGTVNLTLLKLFSIFYLLYTMPTSPSTTAVKTSLKLLRSRDDKLTDIPVSSRTNRRGVSAGFTLTKVVSPTSTSIILFSS